MRVFKSTFVIRLSEFALIQVHSESSHRISVKSVIKYRILEHFYCLQITEYYEENSTRNWRKNLLRDPEGTIHMNWVHVERWHLKRSIEVGCKGVDWIKLPQDRA